MTCPRGHGDLMMDWVMTGDYPAWVCQSVCLICGYRVEPGWTPLPHRPLHKQAARRKPYHPATT